MRTDQAHLAVTDGAPREDVSSQLAAADGAFETCQAQVAVAYGATLRAEAASLNGALRTSHLPCGPPRISAAIAPAWVVRTACGRWRRFRFARKIAPSSRSTCAAGPRRGRGDGLLDQCAALNGSPIGRRMTRADRPASGARLARPARPICRCKNGRRFRRGVPRSPRRR